MKTDMNSTRRLRRAFGPTALALALMIAPAVQADDEDGERLVSLIVQAADGKDDSKGVDRTGVVHKKDKAAAVTIRRLLKTRKVSVNFAGTKFSEAVDFLRDVSGLNIVVSKKAREAIDDSGRDVRLKLNKIKLRSCLILMLQGLSDELCFGIRHGVLVFGTKDEFRGRSIVLRVYDIGDIIRPKPDFPAPEAGIVDNNLKPN